MSWGNPVDMNIQNASLMTNCKSSANQSPHEQTLTNERAVSEHDPGPASEQVVSRMDVF